MLVSVLSSKYASAAVYVRLPNHNIYVHVVILGREEEKLHTALASFENKD